MLFMEVRGREPFEPSRGQTSWSLGWVRSLEGSILGVFGMMNASLEVVDIDVNSVLGDLDMSDLVLSDLASLDLLL